MLLVSNRRLSSDDKDGDQRCVTQRVQALTKFKARELRHHQIEEDGGRFVFQCKPKSLFGFLCFDNFVSVRQPHSVQAKHLLVIVNNQNLLHTGFSNPAIRPCHCYKSSFDGPNLGSHRMELHDRSAVGNLESFPNLLRKVLASKRLLEKERTRTEKGLSAYGLTCIAGHIDYLHVS